MRNKMKLYGKRCLSLFLAFAMIVPMCSSYIAQAEAAETTDTETLSWDFSSTDQLNDFALYQVQDNDAFTLKDGYLVSNSGGGTRESKVIYKEDIEDIQSISVDMYSRYSLGAGGGTTLYYGGFYIGLSDVTDNFTREDNSTGLEGVTGLAFRAGMRENSTGNPARRQKGVLRVTKETLTSSTEIGVKEDTTFFARKENNSEGVYGYEPVNLRLDFDGNNVTFTMTQINNTAKSISETYTLNAEDFVGKVGLRADRSNCYYDNLTITYASSSESSGGGNDDVQESDGNVATLSRDFNDTFQLQEFSLYEVQKKDAFTIRSSTQSGGGYVIANCGSGDRLAKAIYNKDIKNIKSISVDMYSRYSLGAGGGTVLYYGGFYIGLSEVTSDFTREDTSTGLEGVEGLCFRAGMRENSNGNPTRRQKGVLRVTEETLTSSTEIGVKEDATFFARKENGSEGVNGYEAVNLRLDFDGDNVTFTMTQIDNPDKSISETYTLNAEDFDGKVGLRADRSNFYYDNLIITYKPAYSVKEAENGQVVVSFAETPKTTPVRNDFSLSFKVDGKTVRPNVTGCTYDAANKEAKITFEPIESNYSTERVAKVTVDYCNIASELVTKEFIVPAGNNQAPSASNVTLINLSTELGEKPCCKGMLEVEYLYSDPDGDAEGETDYQWYISDTKDGTYEPLQGIRTETIILIDDYVGKYLKCEVKATDIYGNTNTTGVMSTPSEEIQATEGNPLTDWFLEAQFGISNHFISSMIAAHHSEEEKWNTEEQTWNDYVGEFDVELYAQQLSQTNIKFVIITLGQNTAYYCAPNEVYDKYLREAGLLGEGETNPKTVSYENDLPMRMADALEPYGIKLMLYLPTNPPKAAHWVEEEQDYIVTERIFKNERNTDRPYCEETKKIHSEMIKWWSEHYGDKIAGWWFDGMYRHNGAYDSQMNMANEYNVSTLANAAKAGNPYSIITLGGGTDENVIFAKDTEYHDYTCGEVQGFNKFPTDGRWAAGTTDCQNFQFGPLGTTSWGSGGVKYSNEHVLEQAQKSIAKSYVLGFDVKVNHLGQIDPGQLEQLVWLKENLAAETLEKENLALNKTASASSYYSTSYDASKVVDGDTGTRWSAKSKSSAEYPNNVGEWIEIDLEQSKWIGSFEIAYYVKNVPKSITVQVRNDIYEAWETIIAKAEAPALNLNASGDALVSTKTYSCNDPVYGRYVRILFEDGSDNNIALNEVKIYAPFPTITKLDDTTAETVTGVAPELPIYVAATYSDMSKKGVEVSWEAIEEKDYANPGTFTVEGSVVGTDLKVTCTVTVTLDKDSDDVDGFGNTGNTGNSGNTGTSDSSGSANDSEAPKTGDAANVFIIMVVFLGAALAIAGIIFKKKYLR